MRADFCVPASGDPSRLGVFDYLGGFRTEKAAQLDGIATRARLTKCGAHAMSIKLDDAAAVPITMNIAVRAVTFALRYKLRLAPTSPCSSVP